MSNFLFFSSLPFGAQTKTRVNWNSILRTNEVINWTSSRRLRAYTKFNTEKFKSYIVLSRAFRVSLGFEIGKFRNSSLTMFLILPLHTPISYSYRIALPRESESERKWRENNTNFEVWLNFFRLFFVFCCYFCSVGIHRVSITTLTDIGSLYTFRSPVANTERNK